MTSEQELIQKIKQKLQVVDTKLEHLERKASKKPI
jgi:hypothetical protein